MTATPGFGNNLVYLSVLIQRRFTQLCAEHDLTNAQAHLLCLVKDRPHGMSELGPLLGLAKPGLSGLVDRTERRGLVQRCSAEHDRRACTVSSTPLGKEIGDALYADVAARLPGIVDQLSPADRRLLEELVAAVIGATASDPCRADGDPAP
ncbi:transcriptional regulator [Actinoplanes philippinensis]|uniref:DNA-binding transcriptional regulator, MarR family n=1 Tax=Actinoplanes philippinensis TaxID=35752 RepID=A0A1I2GFZ9_9ACTN|nr:MarR family winged helix-turn-helix transcriptional regulator [Actinoplanes philippinensis]GIE76908.1 transcriptional regulator [Actinoplanes philippinensis]SFF16128.1 DNA-binding transcriptional regulator, MarR family [Actinoplanes philippinensis]